MTTKLFVGQKSTLSKLLPYIFWSWASNDLSRVTHIQHICACNLFPLILAPIPPYYPGLIQRQSPFRNGAEYTVTNFSFHHVYYSRFSLFQNWGFTSWRGKMKINILSCIIWNLVVHVQRGHQGYGLVEVIVQETWEWPRSWMAFVTQPNLSSWKRWTHPSWLRISRWQQQLSWVGSIVRERNASRMGCSQLSESSLASAPLGHSSSEYFLLKSFNPTYFLATSFVLDCSYCVYCSSCVYTSLTFLF